MGCKMRERREKKRERERGDQPSLGWQKASRMRRTLLQRVPTVGYQGPARLGRCPSQTAVERFKLL